MAEINYRSDMGVALIDYMGDDRRIAQAARVSTNTDTTDRPHGKLVKRLWADGHTSPFEHNTLTVKADVPIFVAREWMRHRTMSFNEVSGRYTDMKPMFYVPGDDRPLVQSGKAIDYELTEGSFAQRIELRGLATQPVEMAWGAYRAMLGSGIAREVARNVLPLSLYTSFYATANLLNWFRFLGLRTDESALWEIRDAADQVEAIIEYLWPVATESFREER